MNVEQILKAAEDGLTDREIIDNLQTYQRCLKNALVNGQENNARRYAETIESIYKRFGTRIDAYIKERV
jgi:hypothetical protein